MMVLRYAKVKASPRLSKLHTPYIFKNKGPNIIVLDPNFILFNSKHHTFEQRSHVTILDLQITTNSKFTTLETSLPNHTISLYFDPKLFLRFFSFFSLFFFFFGSTTFFLFLSYGFGNIQLLHPTLVFQPSHNINSTS